ncbi:hypothetical protein GGI42DRAFT_219900 [Trichoderma sp. SZMC 28013]
MLRNTKTHSRSLPYSSGDKERADRARSELSEWTNITGVVVMPCSRCENAGVGEKCKFSTRSIRCQRCNSLKKTCDGGAVANSLARLRRDYVKYDAEEREAADQLAEYQQRATEALAHLQRVCKLKQEVKERGDQVFSRGIEAIDAWDGVVQQEPIIGD